MDLHSNPSSDELYHNLYFWFYIEKMKIIDYYRQNQGSLVSNREFWLPTLNMLADIMKNLSTGIDSSWLSVSF